MIVATLVIALLAPGLAFLIFLMVQVLRGKADPPEQRPAEGSPRRNEETDEKGEA